jgi:hypothetical protein
VDRRVIRRSDSRGQRDQYQEDRSKARDEWVANSIPIFVEGFHPCISTEQL